MKRAAAAAVPEELPVGRALPSNQMIVRDGGSEEFPGAVMIADVREASGLRNASVGEEVSIADGCSDPEASHCVASISVDRLRVTAIVRSQAVAVQVPQRTSWVQTYGTNIV